MKSDVLVISPYPPQGSLYAKGVGGAAHFVKNIIQNIKSINFQVLAQISTEKNKQYQDTKKITVKQVWHKGSSLFVWDLAKEIIKSKDSSKALLNFEYKMYGEGQVKGIINLLLYLVIPFLIKLKGMRIFMIFHPVVLELKELRAMNEHLNLSANNPIWIVYAWGMKVYAAILGLFCNKMIVFESITKQRLAKLPFISESKVEVIAHPVYPPVGQQPVVTTRQRLESKTPFKVMFFGFLSFYKGADWLIDCALRDSWPKDIELIIAGGASPSMEAEGSDYYSRQVTRMKQKKSIIHTGFVEEKELPRYFDQADLIILPYRLLIASSGPLAMALGYQKPFIMSERIERYTETPDFQKVLKKLQIKNNQFVFKYECASLVKLLRSLAANPTKLAKLQELSKALGEERSLSNIAQAYQGLITV